MFSFKKGSLFSDIQMLAELRARGNIALLTRYFSADAIINLLATSKPLHDFFMHHFMVTLDIPWQYYRSASQADEKRPVPRSIYWQYHGVRDYFLLLYLQQYIGDAEHINFAAISDIIASSTFSKIIFRAAPSQIQNLMSITSEWQEMLIETARYNQHVQASRLKFLKHRVEEFEFKTTPLTLDELERDFIDSTHIVMTFDATKIHEKEKRILNYFQVKKTNFAKSGKDHPDYYKKRLAAETIHYLHAETSKLLRFLLNIDAHPCYATAQFNTVQAVSGYGKSFILFNPVIYQVSTAIFGAPLSRMEKIGKRLTPVRLSGSPLLLFSQLPDRVLTRHLVKDEKRNVELNIQYQGGEATNYIEVHLPANISPTDPEAIQHVHYAFEEHLPTLSYIKKLSKKGITISTGTNPFISSSFLKSFQAKERDRYYINILVHYIHLAAIHIGETSAPFLKLVNTEKSLNFTFKITRNYPDFHQAQAAAVLYLLGVRKYFKKISTIDFLHNELHTVLRYTLFLDGNARSQGELTDQDAYTYSRHSLTTLLNVFLKRIFSILLVSFQNEIHQYTYNKPHPITGLGATDASNQTRRLYLGDANQQYDITVQWLYNVTILEVFTEDDDHIELVNLFLNKVVGKHVTRKTNQFLINQPLPIILKILEQRKCPYQATIVYDDEKEPGNILLAYRKENGYTTPGGHNNDPYSWIGLFTPDYEFGLLKKPWKIITDVAIKAGESSNPHTQYFSMPSSVLQEIKLDEYEFAADSLQRIPLYRLHNPDEKQALKAISLLECSIDEYKNTFKSALPLRPLPSLIVYIKNMEDQLKIVLENCFFNLIGMNVVINNNVEKVVFKERLFWIAAAGFGEIFIESNHHDLVFLTEYLAAFKNMLIKQVSETSIVLQYINPWQIMNTIKNSFINILHMPITFTARALKAFTANPIKFLSKLPPANVINIFLMALSNNQDIIALLDQEGGKYAVFIIDELIRVIQKEENVSQFNAKNNQLLHELKMIAMKLLKTRWGPNEKTALHIALEENNLEAVEYLCPRIIDLNEVDKEGNTALHCVTKATKLNIVNYLIKINPMIICTKKNNQGILALKAVEFMLKREDLFTFKFYASKYNDFFAETSMDEFNKDLNNTLNKLPKKNAENLRKTINELVEAYAHVIERKHISKVLWEIEYKKPKATKRQIHRTLIHTGFFNFFSNPTTVQKKAYCLAMQADTRKDYFLKLGTLTLIRQ